VCASNSEAAYVGHSEAVHVVDLARGELLGVYAPEDRAVRPAGRPPQEEFVDAVAVHVEKPRRMGEAEARHPVVHPAELRVAEEKPELMVENCQTPAHPSNHHARGEVFFDVTHDDAAAVGHGIDRFGPQVDRQGGLATYLSRAPVEDLEKRNRIPRVLEVPARDDLGAAVAVQVEDAGGHLAFDVDADLAVPPPGLLPQQGAVLVEGGKVARALRDDVLRVTISVQIPDGEEAAHSLQVHAAFHLRRLHLFLLSFCGRSAHTFSGCVMRPAGALDRVLRPRRKSL